LLETKKQTQTRKKKNTAMDNDACTDDESKEQTETFAPWIVRFHLF
jgi:hypothetical protein